MPDEVRVSTADHVTVLEINRPPHNFFDVDLVHQLADALEDAEDDSDVRALVLCSNGKNFCAGANFGGRSPGQEPGAGGAGIGGPEGPAPLYAQAIRLFQGTKPIVAAVQGAAVGGGLGVACVADFRVASEASRFSANFTQLGLHPGFGLTATLPAIVGAQHAMDLFYTGRRIDGVRAHEIGLVDQLAAAGQEREAALAFARQIAASAPLAVQSVRVTLRGDLADKVRAATAREVGEQLKHFGTEDLAEGLKATAERRTPTFVGR
jgi:enoyl-CoA hydratase/carnithine racemase